MSSKVTIGVRDFGEAVIPATGHVTLADGVRVSLTVDVTAPDGTLQSLVMLMTPGEAKEFKDRLDQAIRKARHRSWVLAKQEKAAAKEARK